MWVWIQCHQKSFSSCVREGVPGNAVSPLGGRWNQHFCATHSTLPACDQHYVTSLRDHVPYPRPFKTKLGWNHITVATSFLCFFQRAITNVGDHCHGWLFFYSQPSTPICNPGSALCRRTLAYPNPQADEHELRQNYLEASHPQKDGSMLMYFQSKIMSAIIMVPSALKHLPNICK